MLIFPPGHAQAAGIRRLTRRERWLVRTVKAVAALVLVGIAVGVIVNQGPKSSNGCIYATVPGPVGAEQIHECGPTARSTCATVFASGAYTAQAARSVAAECRKAHLPVGR